MDCRLRLGKPLELDVGSSVRPSVRPPRFSRLLLPGPRPVWSAHASHRSFSSFVVGLISVTLFIPTITDS